MEFRFDLTYTSTETLPEQEQPNGFSSINSVIRRDFDSSGAFYSLTESDLKLEFAGSARDTFITARDTDGVDAVVTLEIFERNDEYSPWELVYTGQAAMENLEIDEDFAKVDFDEISLLKKITDRLNVVVETNASTDLDGGSITAAANTLVPITGRPIKRVTELIAQETERSAIFIVGPVYNQEPPEIASSFTGTITPSFEIFKNENEWVTSDQESFIRTQGEVDIYNTLLFYGGVFNIVYEGESYSGSVVCSGSISFFFFQTVVGSFDLYLRELDVDADTVSDTFLQTFIVTGNYGPAGSYVRIAFAGNTPSITVNKNLRYSLYLENNLSSGIGSTYMSGFNGTDFDPLAVTFTLETKVQLSSNNTHFIHEVLRHNIAAISGNDNGLDSQYFGRTQDGYLSDGPASEFVEFNGAKGRGLSDRAQFGTFKERLESLISIFNVGWGVEQVYGGDFQVRIEERSHFYQDVLLKEIDNIEIDSYSEEFYEWFNYTALNVGYKEFVKDDNFSGTLDDFNTETTYSSPVQNYSKGVKRFLSNYIASDILLELTRRQTIAFKTTTSWKYDDNLFILNVNDQASPNNYVQGSRENIQNVNIDYDGNADINFAINPRFNTFNLKSILNSQLFTKPTTSDYLNTNYRISPTEKIFYASGTPELGDTNIYTSGTSPELADDIESGTTKLFDPILIRFRASISAEEEQEIRKAHQNSLINGKNYGYFRVTKPDGNTIDGWLLEMSWNIVDKIATFELIKKA